MATTIAQVRSFGPDAAARQRLIVFAASLGTVFEWYD